jgi:hypothetical protein
MILRLKLLHLMTATNESQESLDLAARIARSFAIRAPFECRIFPGKGNINRQTYLIISESRQEYLLQLLNPEVFSQPHNVMESMISCIRAQKKALSEGVLPPDDAWEVISLVPTKSGAEYLEIPDDAGSRCWRMMIRIGDSFTFKRLSDAQNTEMGLKIAEEAARGLAIFKRLTAEMDPTKVESPLPGYRDTGLYFNQFQSILSGSFDLSQAEHYLPSDPALRKSVEKHFIIHSDSDEFQRRLNDPDVRRFIDLALKHKDYALTLTNKLNSGELKKVIIHGDTKLENFLFSSTTGKVKSLVDMDTIMAHTWLSDWGDMVRSLANQAGEREKNPDNIQIDMEVFRALAKGFLGSAGRLEKSEIGLMVDAAQIIALELGVRFLGDYLRGDSYFSLSPDDDPELNKIRAMVQFHVFERLRENADSAQRFIDSII